MHATVTSIVFAAPHEVICRREPVALSAPPQGAIIQTHYSCISAGTELAKLTCSQAFQFPGIIGNRAMGRVVEVGPSCDTARVGDLVFAHTPHASHAATSGLLVKLPEELDCPEAALIGMASVAMTGLRVAQPELADTAVVLGAGLVGQLTAQLLMIAGVRPVLIDRVPARLNIARSCGITDTINADAGDARQQVLEITCGHGAEHVFECTGVPRVAMEAPHYACQSGQIILVGSPRGACETDVTEFLNHFHLHRPHGDLTLRGAHEWKIPLRPVLGLKHSQTRNIQILAELIRRDQLKCRPLLSKVLAPEQASEAYAALVDSPQSLLGVVFDWTTQEEAVHV